MPTWAQGGEVTLRSWPLAAVDPSGDDFSDLAPLGEVLRDARVVALGEQTHGGREEFQFKLRLLRYLHEKLGFEVLLLESGFYEMGRLSRQMEQGGSLDALAPGNVFYMYAKSAEGRALLQYLDRQRALGQALALGGIDSQHSGELSRTELLPRLREMLLSKGLPSGSNADWEALAARVAGLVSMRRVPPAPADQAAFYRHTDALRATLCQDKTTAVESPGWWCQVVLSLQAQARSHWSQDSDYQRDNQMGANAIWLVDRQFGGRKTVIWAHTVHLARGFQRTPTHLQAGEVMHRHWGPAYRVLQFTAGGGEVLDYVRLSRQSLPVLPRGGLEEQLKRSATGLTLWQASAPVGLPQFAYEYEQQGTESFGQSGQLGRNWDLLVYLPRISPVSMVR